MVEHGHCQEYLSRFSDYIDHELSPELCARLEDHLKECENCSIVYNSLKRTIELYQHTLGEEPLPENVRSRLFARLSLDVDEQE